MGLYEHLPYANFHELNLDKILGIVNGIPSMVQQEVIAALQSFPIPDGSITTAKLADYAVSTAKIANNNVISSKIASSAVTTAKIASGAVTEAKIASEAVTTVKIADEAVTFDKLNDAFGVIESGINAGGNVTVPSGLTSPYTQMAVYEIPATGLYMLMPWVQVYGNANTGAGVFDTNLSDTSGATSGYAYAARLAVPVPAYVTATPSAYNWIFIRSFNAGDKVYLNFAHSTGIPRSVRANIRAMRIK